ncbi:NADH-ubiquinone oxidoreductase subunit C [Klebsiella pneumoniae]|uniref:NADH-ubiquinone oxidoreductase subunit C n=1 Tax=Klebsiella pneumoniae TaxID=573 RepID=A0A2X3EZ99_KLEPN|nr:NADH-ubiquinone oxidoreductase subunit C [Klebsiella pneumoniae]
MPLPFSQPVPAYRWYGVKREQLLEVGDFLKKLPKPYVMLFDLHGMDERLRTHAMACPPRIFPFSIT